MTQDTLPGDDEAWAPSTRSAFLPATERRIDIRFTGSGSEYFRIWIVNLLLSLVTLGFYLPFAKARRLKYFWANTLVDGEALSFHGNPWSMFRGFVLMVLLLAAYGFAGRVSALSAVIAFCVLGVVWPALWRSSLRFRLANTGWRGLRMSFDGGLAEAYGAFAPIALPLLASVAVNGLMREKVAAVKQGLADRQSLGSLALWAALISLVVMLMAPWVLARIKRYQHGGYCVAAQQTRLELGVWPFYKLALTVVGMVLGVVIALGILAAIAIPALHLGPAGRGTWVLVFIAFIYLPLILVLGPFALARFQNMLWSATSSRDVAFDSRLGVTDLIWVMFKNFVFTVLTLGLYWPFATVALTRIRLETVSLKLLRGSVDEWTSGLSPAGGSDATGEAAADFFGFDLGL